MTELDSMTIENLYLSAESGDPAAQFEIAKLYLQDSPFEKIPEVAVKWLKKASLQEYEDAMRKLLELYKSNVVAAEGQPTVNELMQKLADSGDTELQVELANSYLQNADTSDRAIQLLEKASASGNLEAILKLADLYQKGELVAVNHERSYELYEKAAEAGDPESGNRLGFAWLYGQHPIYPKQTDYEKAFSYFTIAKKDGKPLTYFCLSQMYHDGLGVKQDMVKSVEYLKMAADMKMPIACAEYGRYLLNADGTHEADPSQAAKYLSIAAENGDTTAKSLLVTLFLQGTGGSMDAEKVLAYAKEVAEDGTEQSRMKLANVYHTTEQYDQALEIMKEYAEQGNANAEYFMGYCYIAAQGVEKNFKTAKEWLKKASEHGHPKAKQLMKELF